MASKDGPKNLEDKEDKLFEEEEAQSTYELNNQSELVNESINHRLNDSKIVKTKIRHQEKT